jgi:hypothetical protein
MEREKSLETSLVLTSGFILLYILTKIELFVYLAFGFGIIGIFLKPAAKVIATAWFKLADILNFFVSKLVLGTLYFVVLVPTSILSRVFKKESLKLKNSSESMWYKRDYTYSANDLENIW